MTIKEALKRAIYLLNIKNIEEPILKSKIILANCLNKTKEYLFIHENEDINKDIEEIFFKKIDELCGNIPLQYITNQQEFMGLNFFVNENVLIPRNDTEILVENVISEIKENIKENSKKYKILDMCTGSGIIAVTIAKTCQNVDITAIDKSEKALEVAIKNAESNNVLDKIKFIKSDMFEKLNNLSANSLNCDRNVDNILEKNIYITENEVEKYDIIVSNPPYIETETIKTLSKEVQNEPKMALDGGYDGLDFYKIIAENANKFLKENGKIFLEIGYNQKENVIRIFKNNYKHIKCVKDLSGLDRVIIVK